MHNFLDILERCFSVTMHHLDKLQAQIEEELQTRASTTLVENLQMVNLQRAIFVTGVFSMLDGILQNKLSCKKGLNSAMKMLDEKGKDDLCNKFRLYSLANNVLKHGEGRSFEKLKTQREYLPFEIKSNHSELFFEGDVSEIDTLIKVDGSFLEGCKETISLVWQTLFAE